MLLLNASLPGLKWGSHLCSTFYFLMLSSKDKYLLLVHLTSWILWSQQSCACHNIFWKWVNSLVSSYLLQRFRDNSYQEQNKSCSIIKWNQLCLVSAMLFNYWTNKCTCLFNIWAKKNTEGKRTHRKIFGYSKPNYTSFSHFFSITFSLLCYKPDGFGVCFLLKIFSSQHQDAPKSLFSPEYEGN